MAAQGSKIGVPLTWLAKNEPRWANITEGPMAHNVFNPDRLLTEEGKQQGWLMPFGAHASITAALASCIIHSNLHSC